MVQKNIAMIGCGGRLRGVVKGIPGINETIRVVGGFDPLAESRQKTEELFGSHIRWADDFREAINSEDVDWVFIGSPNCYHRDHAVAAFEAGKDVFCEKPLATTFEDCMAMKEAHERSGRNFILGFTLRYSPHYRKLKEMVESGLVGDVISFEFNETLGFNHGGYIHADWRRLTSIAGTHLLEKCCHDIDLANWIIDSRAKRVASFGGVNFFKPANAGRIEELGTDENGKKAYLTWPRSGDKQIHPFTADKDIVDNQVAIVEYGNDVRATFHTNCNSGIPERRMYINGSHGAIRADVVAGTIEFARIGFGEERQQVDCGVSGGHGGGDSILGTALADSILNDAPSVTPLDAGFASALTCFAIDEAMERGTVVALDSYWQKSGLADGAAPA